ncbi:MAG: glycosyltransferase family 9 protein [Bacteroidia bacterium]
MNDPSRIIISRTDGIGDVMLTLPMCGLLKEYFPGTKIYFLARNYTKPVVECCSHIEQFLSYDEFEKSATRQEFLKNINADIIVHVFPRKSIAYPAKDADIPTRIGTSHRAYHWITCNERPNLGRKNSKLHEAQLNIALLESLGVNKEIALEALPSYYGFNKIKPLTQNSAALIDERKFNLILHPKSHGSGREWGVFNFAKLIELLPEDKFKIFISGSPDESVMLKEWISKLPPHVIDITGKMPLEEFISFINECDGLVAASTGPLHIAAALNKYTCGLFAPIRPVHPGRWAPLGEKAGYMMIKKNCNDCENMPQACKCIRLINPFDVSERLQKWYNSKIKLNEPHSMTL